MNNYNEVNALLQTDIATLDNCKKALDFAILSTTDIISKLCIIEILIKKHPSILNMKNSSNQTPIQLTERMVVIFDDYHYKRILDKLKSLYLIHNIA